MSAPESELAYHLRSWDSLETLAETVTRLVLRDDFLQPGFALIDLGTSCDSLSQRQMMFELFVKLKRIHLIERRRNLAFHAVSRFDQQVSTRPHLDGGPEQSFLMLGYEPTSVASEMNIYDYSRRALDRGLAPKRFLELHNPMFGQCEELIEPDRTALKCFWQHRWQIVLINNSCAAYDPDQNAWQGVLHSASISAPDPAASRIINSMLIASLSLDEVGQVSDEQARISLGCPEICRSCDE